MYRVKSCATLGIKFSTLTYQGVNSDVAFAFHALSRNQTKGTDIYRDSSLDCFETDKLFMVEHYR
jgi:hypothetical protein